MSKTKLGLNSVVFAVALVAAIGCSSYDPGRADVARQEIDATIGRFKANDPGIDRFFRNAYGYAVFPTIGRGGVAVGGAYGSGYVYEQGRAVGSAQLIQGSFGFQLGAQSYSQIIFFENKAALDRFKSGKLEFSARASAVIATTGAAAEAAYENGVAVFVLVQGGLMGEAAIGGQSFQYSPY